MAPTTRSTELASAIAALQPRLRRFAYGLCGSLDEADDIVQAAFERALSRLHQWQPGTRLESWMFRIVHTVFLNQHAKAKVRSRYAADADPDAQISAEGATAQEASLELERVRRCLAQVSPDQCAALLLVAVEGLSYAEAAQALNVPVGTLTSRVARARAALAGLLESPREKPRLVTSAWSE